MTETLDNILSGNGDAVTAQEANTNEENVAQQTDGESQQQTDAATQEEEVHQADQKMVPHGALHAEKQKVKRYTEEVSSLRQEIADRDSAWERRIAALMEAQKPTSELQKKPDWYENPEAATQFAVQQSVNPQFDQITQTLMANAQIVAGLKYGDDKVAAAEQAFLDALRSNRVDQADYQKVVRSPNRYAAAVQWHQRQLAQAEIGDDPAAYKAKVEAEVLARYGLQPGSQQQAQPGQQATPTVMPSNIAGARNVGSRSGPAWSGPPTLQDIFAR